MSDAPQAPHCLPLTGTPIPDCDFDAPLHGLRSGDLHRGWSAYNDAAKQAADVGNTTIEMLYRSLGIVCSYAQNFDSTTVPFNAVLQWEGKRSAIPDDLTSADLDLLSSLRAKTQSPPLRARIGDLLWIRRRDHVAAKEAAADYLTSADLALTKDDWLHAIRYFQRALQLGHNLGRKNEAWKKAEEAAVAALGSPLVESEPFFASHLLGVLSKLGAGDFAVQATLSQTHAEKAASAGDHRRSRIYREHEASFWSLAKRPEDEARARLAAAETYEREADQCLKRSTPSHMAASHFLAQGVEALRRAHAAPTEIARVRQKLADYQRQSLNEMQTHTVEIDISKPFEQAEKLVEHSVLAEALKRLAFARPLTSAKEIRDEVIKAAQAHPLSHLLGTSLLDAAGRVKERVGGLLGAGGKEEANIEARMFRHVAEHTWRFRAVAFIEPARRKIWLQHTPQQDDLAFLVVNNPFVPPGHEGIFLRGLHYGLMGDFLLAAHLLAPQVENSIRYVLEQNGADVSNLESDLTQPVKTLGPLLTMAESKEIFGDDWLFEFRGLLVEKTGYSFRHDIAHGFATEAGCYGPETLNLWWMVLRLCYTPLIQLGQRNPPNSER